jgi:TolA-binding protein
MSVRYFSSLIQDFPRSTLLPDAYYALGTIYAEEEKAKEAVEQFNKVIALGSSDLAGQSAVAIADIFAKQEKFNEALAAYREKLKEYPNLSPLIYPKIGDSLARSGKPDEALDWYRKSLSLVPVRQMPDIHFKIAELLQSQSRIEDSVEEYLKVTYLFAESRELATKAFLRVAKIYEDQDKPKEAIAIYKKVVSLDVPEKQFSLERIQALQEEMLPLGRK